MIWKGIYVLFLLTSFPCLRGHISKRGLIFPPTSLYGTFVAIAVPLDIPDKNVFVSYNFESNYSVVTNITEIDEVIFPNLPIFSNINVGGVFLMSIYTANCSFDYDFIKKLNRCHHRPDIDEYVYNAKVTEMGIDTVVTGRHSRSITREMAYKMLETKFNEHGINGKECLLRNICEAAETPLYHNGLLGHIMHIVFTPSSSKEEGLSNEYYEAEDDGIRGNCDKYLDPCPYSLFDFVTRLVEFPHNNL